MSGAIVAVAINVAISVTLSVASSLIMSAFAKKPTAVQPKQPDQNFNQKVNLKNPVAPRQIVYHQARIGGVLLFAHRTEPRMLHLVMGVAGHQVDDFFGIFMQNEFHWNPAIPFASGNILDGNGFVTAGLAFTGGAGRARFLFFVGSPGQSYSPALINEVNNGDIIDDSMNFEGIAYYYARLEHGVPGPQEVLFASGPPALSAWVRGKQCFDTRDSVWRISENPAIILYDYMTNADFGCGIDSAYFDLDSVAAAANICDEQVPLAAGGTQNRYTFDGSFTMEEQYQEVIEKILLSMQGRLVYNGNKYRFLAGAYYAPTSPTITEADLRAGPTISTILSRRDRFNGVKGTYVDPNQKFIELDYPAYLNPTWAAEDGEEIWRDVNLLNTSSAARAQRIAKIELERARRQLTVKLPGNLGMMRYQAGDTIAVTIPEQGWTAKTFEVRSVSMQLDSSSLIVGVDIEAVEVDAGSYTWDGSEELPHEIPTTPPDSTGDPATVNPPLNVTATEEVYVASVGGSVKSRLVIEWDAPEPDQIAQFDVQYKLQASSTWISLPRVPFTTDSADYKTTIEDIAIGLYHVRVASVNIWQVLSTYVQISATVSGDTTPPEDVTGFTSVSGVSGFTTFTWSQPVHERARNGTIEIRYSPLTSGAAFNSSTVVFIGSATTQNAVLLTQIGTYLAKFKTANLVYSTNAASVVITTRAQPQVGVEIVNSLPVSDLYDGRIVFLTTDGKLYRYDLTLASWTAAVPASDVTGQLTDEQIAELDAAKLTGTIDATLIEDGSITTPKLAAGSVTTAKLVAFAVTANEIAAAAITSAKIQAGAILANAIGTGAVTADKILAGAVTAAKIQVAHLSAIAADLGSITAGTITGALIRTSAGVARAELSQLSNDFRIYLNNLKVAQMGGTVAAGLLEIVGFFPLFYPAYFRNESTTGGGSENGGGALKATSIGGWAAEFSNEATTAGTLDTMAIRAGNIGIGGGSAHIGESAGSGGAAFRSIAGGYAPFTGMHDGVVDRATVGGFTPGDIVVDGAVVRKKLSDVLTEIHLSSAPNQAAIGVFVNTYEGGEKSAPASMRDDEGRPVPEWAEKRLTHILANINSLGEGCVNVCGEAGPMIAAGDLIVTSSTAGKGMKQADDVVHSYTVARAREAVTFANAGEVKQIACIYLCG